MQRRLALFPSRRRLLAYGSLFLAGGIATGHGFLVERHWTEVTKRRFGIDLGVDGPRRLRIAVLTDFHYDPLLEGEFFERVVAETNAEQPDLILLLGDFVSDAPEPAAELLSILAKLQAPLGVRAVLGNHDCWASTSRVARELERQGIDLLQNRRVTVAAGDGELILAGLESAWGGKPNPSFLQRLPAGKRVLMLHHEPDYIDTLPQELRDKVAFQVSGHTHGGQICAPGGIVIETVSYGHKYRRGHYHVSPRTQLYVSRGIGTAGIHARLFCRPEIAILELTNTARLSA